MGESKMKSNRIPTSITLDPDLLEKAKTIVKNSNGLYVSLSHVMRLALCAWMEKESAPK